MPTSSYTFKLTVEVSYPLDGLAHPGVPIEKLAKAELDRLTAEPSLLYDGLIDGTLPHTLSATLEPPTDD